MLPQALDSLLNLVYPQFCHACAAKVLRRADGVACDVCWTRTRLPDELIVACDKCATPLTGFAQSQPLRPTSASFSSTPIADYTVHCHRCADHHYDLARAAGFYEHALAATVLNLKQKPFVPSRLRELLAVASFDPALAGADVVVPVPLSKMRLEERGFNQAEVLAKIVADVRGLPLDSASLTRARHTKIHRAPLDRRARELTVENAFVIVRPKLIENKRVLLIDDVLTSGATVSACAKVLKKHGAVKVVVLTAARAV